MKKIVIAIVLLFVYNSLIFSSNQVQTNLDSATCLIKATTALIHLDITENQSVRVFKDTLLFEEDFNDFSRQGQIGLATTIGGNSVLTILPSSMTQFPNCKAKKLKLSQDNACNIQYIDSKFRTPILSIPENSQLSFRVKNGGSNSQLIVRDTIFYLKKNIDSVKVIYLAACSFIEFSKQNADGSSLLIDDVKIFSPRETISYNLNNNILSLQDLMPETKYYIEIVNQDSSIANTYYFITEKQIDNFSPQVLNTDSVLLSWVNNENNSTFLLSVDSLSNVADDLLFSKVATTSLINVVEIFNPTERDICLKDYEFVAYQHNSIVSSTPLRYLFFEKDSVKSNSCVLIALNSNISPYDSNLIVYPIQSNSAFSGGNDSYLLLKKDSNNIYDTIDLFGRIKNSTSEAEPPSFANSVLVRQSHIKKGVKHNPINVDNVYSQWDINEFNLENINSILGNHTINPSIDIHNICNFSLSVEQDSIYLNDVDFDGVYRCQIKNNEDIIAATVFRMGKKINAVCSGDWNDSTIWEDRVLPSTLDKAILPRGIKVNIPQNTIAQCAELVINSDYSTCDTVNKAEIKNYGSLLVRKSVVKSYFSRFSNQENDLMFVGLPINISNKDSEDIFNGFNIEEGENLYYCKENYSPMSSTWIAYNENLEDSNFFKQNLGYLLSYSQNKELEWEGDLFFAEELELLNNASYSEQGGNGYHLCANPYPFSVNYNNFSKNNIAGMWILKPETGQYIPYNPNEPFLFVIPPFVGFMTKVTSNENLLKIHKQELQNQENLITNIDKLHLNFVYEGGEDDFKVYFRENVSESIDDYDVYKLFSFSKAPDIYSNYEQKDLSIVSLPLWNDSVIIPFTCGFKTISNYELNMRSFPQNVLRAELYDNSNEFLTDFVQDSSYIFQPLSNNEEKHFVLKLYSFDLDLAQVDDVCDFKIIQNGDIIKVISNDKIESVCLYDMKGVMVSESKTNNIKIPKIGSYLLRFEINNEIYSRKIIYLK